MFNKNKIKEDKLAYKNKLQKANRLNKVEVKDLIGDVNEDFFNNISGYLNDFISVCEDYNNLHNYMREFDKYRKSVITNIKVKHKEEIELLQKEYDILVEENKELLEFKKKFTHDKKVNVDVINQVKKLKAEGVTHVKVSEIVGVSICTVTKIMQGKYDK